MTDELKHKFEQLVADAPPPSGVPSEGVFDRVRTVKRRRTATAGILATAVVVAAAIAAGNLANLNSAPAPVTNTPGPTPIVTAPPTITPSIPTTKTSIGGSINTLPPVNGTDDPPPNNPSSPTAKTSTPVEQPLGVTIKLHPKVNGRTATMTATISGTVLSPLTVPGGQELPADTGIVDRSGGTMYHWGDGSESIGSDGGAQDCKNAKSRYTGSQTISLGSHVFTKPGTYTLDFGIYVCKSNGGYDNFGQSATFVIR